MGSFVSPPSVIFAHYSPIVDVIVPLPIYKKWQFSGLGFIIFIHW
jgi:hypothetical protein